MATVTNQFMTAWRSGNHVAARRPMIVVEIRGGSWRRDYRSWPVPIDATIPGETDTLPWYPIFTETTPWVEIPNILSCDITQDFEQNGLSVVTIVADNVGRTPAVGPFGDLYHAIERGYLSPSRGYDAPSRPASGLTPNEWSDVITEQRQVRVWQGFGPPQRDGGGAILTSGGANGAWVFSGLIDDVDADSDPAKLTITARAGKVLTDSRVFGWNKSKQLPDPITFCDRTEAATATVPGEKWILIDDLSDVVRVVLRWAGYQDWEVEDTGTRLKGKAIFNRTSFLIDIIKRAQEITGFIFFVSDPIDGNSQGVPVFRRSSATQEDGVIAEVRDVDLLTGLQTKRSEEPLGYIIRVRGKESRDGVPLGGDPNRRLMYVYRPPWTADNTLGGVIKHQTHTDNALRSLVECQIGAYLIAIADALAAFTAVIEIPANPLFELDDHVGLTDTATGLNTRLWITNRTMRYQSDTQKSWTTTLQGALTDTADLTELMEEIAAIDFSPEPSPVVQVSRDTNGRFRL